MRPRCEAAAVTEPPDAVGVAWAGDPWVAVTFAEGTYETAVVVDDVGAIWSRYGEDATSIVAGVPAGLVEDGDPERRCDELARAALGERAGAVTTPPSRRATRRRRYPAARRLHERTTGGNLSEAAFEQAPAITALDELLQEVPAARSVVHSSHPELAYRVFADEPLSHSPATAGGYAERMRALVERDRDAPPTVQSAAEAVTDADVTVADVLDAVALAYTARSDGHELRTLPADPPTDPTGLPMAWYYRSETALDVE